MRLIVAALCGGWGMVFSLAVNDAKAQGELVPGHALYWVLHSGLILSALIVLALLGLPLFANTWRTLSRGRITVEALFTLSVLGAFGGSLVATFTTTGDVYYEVVSITLAIYTLGNTLGARSRKAALAAAESLRGEFETAWLMTDGGQRRRVSVADLQPGDVVSVGPGEAVTVDGTVESGEGYVRETALTGEPSPVVRRMGERLLAGTHSVDGAFSLRVEAGQGSRRLDAVLEAVEHARMQPSKLQEQADRIMRYFVPFVVSVCLLTFLGWLSAAGWSQALFNAMAVLLVACPCALGLATPIAVWSGLHRLSRLGLVSRTGDFLDTLARCDVMVFDKTGTLSFGELNVADIVLPEGGHSRAEVLAAVRAAEQANSHPIARALAEVKLPEGAQPLAALSARQVAGKGVEALLERPGGGQVAVQVGTLDLMPESARAGFERIQTNGNGAAKSRVYISMDEQTAGVALLEETLRTGTENNFDELKELGVECRILTGDPNPAWDAIGSVKLMSGLSPADKERHVRELGEAGRTVVFVGDGVNDAAAMALCPGSIAMGQGAGLARATSSAVLMGEQLSQLPGAVRLARRIRRAVGNNLRFALSYNVAGIALACTGYLHPVTAALIMLISSALVSVRAARSARG